MSRTSPPITWISRDDPPEAFPALDTAFTEPEGLLAAGGDLSSERLLYAYRHGIFPWYSEGQPVLWWSPDPRCVLEPDAFHLSRRLRRSLKTSAFEVSFNKAFADIIDACAEPRGDHAGTWITQDMRQAYCELHRAGWAHSVEIWLNDTLVGGLYGLAIGRAFFGESMFSRVNNASKAAMLALCQELLAREFLVFDCQVASPHLHSLGATELARTAFAARLEQACAENSPLNLPRAVHRPITDYL